MVRVRDSIKEAVNRLYKIGYVSDVDERGRRKPSIYAVTLGQLSYLMESPYNLKWLWSTVETMSKGYSRFEVHIDYIRIFSTTTMQTLQIKWTGDKRFDPSKIDNTRNIIKIVLSSESKLNLVTFGQISEMHRSIDEGDIASWIKFSFSMLHSLYDVEKKRLVWNPAWNIIIKDTAFRLFNLIANVTEVDGKSRECDQRYITGHLLDKPIYNLYKARAKVLAVTLAGNEAVYSVEELTVCVPEDELRDVINGPRQYLALQEAKLPEDRLGYPVIIPYSWKEAPGEPLNLLAVALLTIAAWKKYESGCAGFRGIKVSTIKQRAKKIRKKLGLMGDKGDYMDVLEDLIENGVFERVKCGVGDLASQSFVRVRSEIEILYGIRIRGMGSSNVGDTDRKPLPESINIIASDLKRGFAVIV